MRTRRCWGYSGRCEDKHGAIVGGVAVWEQAMSGPSCLAHLCPPPIEAGVRERVRISASPTLTD